jgi:Flp pilus assembly protein protease CpaA
LWRGIVPRERCRPRSAYDVMAAVALVIAVAGGTAYAAATIGSGDIKNSAVLTSTANGTWVYTAP